jgi:4-hydroxybutyryl-CoA dehydratase/vinylacetyl-CoA-Delta-isomerase
MPSQADFDDPEIGPLMKKYLSTCDGVSPKDRYKLLRFLENISMGVTSPSYRTESLHGAGSPQAQRIMIFRQAKLEEKKKLAKEILDVD